MYSPLTRPKFSGFRCGCKHAPSWVTAEHSGRKFMRGSLQILFVLAVSMAIVPVTVLGQTNNKNGNKRRWGSSPNTTQTKTTPPVRHGWGDHQANAQNIHASNPTPPPGWAQGRKVGWGGNNPPPGQAKRDPYEHRYYRHHSRHHHLGSPLSKQGPQQPARGHRASLSDRPVHGVFTAGYSRASWAGFCPAWCRAFPAHRSASCGFRAGG
jgi:hypothetical protein